MKNIYIVILFIIVSCGRSQNVFIGDFKSIERRMPIVEIDDQEVPLNIYGLFPLSVIDTLMIVQNEMNDGFFISIINSENYQSYGRYISRGRGENEFLSISLSKKYVMDSSDVKIWINTAPPRKLILLNITKSIELNKTIIDKKIEIENYSLKGVYQWDYISDSMMIGFNQGPIGKQVIKYNIKTDSVLSNIDIYKQSDADFTLFFGLFQIKPDGTKIVNSMLYFNQLNFFSFDTNSGFSVLLNDEITNFDLVKSKKDVDRISYYSDLWSNNNIIIASYYGDKSKVYCTELHVFDWDGNMIKIVKPKNKFKEFTLDEVNKQLYLFGVEEKIYKCDIDGIINL